MSDLLRIDQFGLECFHALSVNCHKKPEKISLTLQKCLTKIFKNTACVVKIMNWRRELRKKNNLSQKKFDCISLIFIEAFY